MRCPSCQTWSHGHPSSPAQTTVSHSQRKQLLPLLGLIPFLRSKTIRLSRTTEAIACHFLVLTSNFLPFLHSGKHQKLPSISPPPPPLVLKFFFFKFRSSQASYPLAGREEVKSPELPCLLEAFNILLHPHQITASFSHLISVGAFTSIKINQRLLSTYCVASMGEITLFFKKKFSAL